uniref:Solute carrier family 18 member A2 n=1 Tax=Xenopus tropicalis TaxID=8364 RepID=A0A6I8R935_XENTR
MARCSPCCQWLKKTWESRAPILLVVAVVMFVDCILFTIIAPIAPALLYHIEYGRGNRTFKNSSGQYPVSNYDSIFNLSHLEDSRKGPYHDQIINITESPGDKKNCYEGKDFLNEENVRVGLLLAIKAFLQLLFNPIVGKLVTRIGYDAPMFFGFVIVVVSTLLFAFANSYAFLCVARGLQGIGSSFTMVSAMGMLAHVFPDDAERGKAMGIAMSGVAIGILAGAPFGSVMYEFVGKASPFLAIGVLALLDGVLQLFILRPTKFTPLAIPPTPYRDLVLDPYIMVTAVGLCIANLTFGMLEPTIPIRMMETMCAPRYQLGLSFLPSVITYFICLNAFSGLAQKIGRWLCIMIGMIIQGIGVMFLPLALNIFGLIGPDAALGFGFGLMETSVMPLMAHLVDLRHTSNYGGIYAISDIALCIGYALGPSCGGAIAKALGFTWLMILLGLLNILYAPIFILLRNPPGKEETKVRPFCFFIHFVQRFMPKKLC